jgi:hypothetical protein
MTEKARDPNAKTKLCSYCGANIPEVAVVCEYCKFHQNHWRNNAVFLAGIAGFLALLFSTTAYLTEKIVDFYKTIRWQDDVNVVYFRIHSNDDDLLYAVIANSGDGPIFISDVVIYWGDSSNESRQLGKTILPKEFVVFGSDTYPKNGDDYEYLSNKSGDMPFEFQRLAGSDYSPNTCAAVTFFSANAVDLERMARYYAKKYEEKLMVAKVEAYVSFYSIKHNKKSTKQIDLVMAAMANTTKKECASSLEPFTQSRPVDTQSSSPNSVPPPDRNAASSSHNATR